MTMYVRIGSHRWYANYIHIMGNRCVHTVGVKIKFPLRSDFTAEFNGDVIEKFTR